MKNLLILLLALVTISFASCNKEDDPTPETTPVTADGSTITATDDVAELAYGVVVIDILSNDGITIADVTTMTIISTNSDSGGQFSLQTDNNNAYTGNVGYSNYTPIAGTTDTATIEVMTNTGYVYTTTLTVSVIE